MQIVPALYIKDGRAAVYHPGNLNDIEYLSPDPYELISKVSKLGIQRIVVIDVDAALPNQKENVGIIGSLANTTTIELEVGGGINEMARVKSLQYAGVDFFILGSVVFDNFAFLHELSADTTVKNERVVISIDLQNKALWTHGWQDKVEDLNLHELIYKCLNVGFSRFLITEIDTVAPSIDFFEKLVNQFPSASFIVGGRINTFEEVEELERIGVKEVVVGNEIYKQENLIKALVDFNASRKAE